MTSTIFGKAWGALVIVLVLLWSLFLGMDIKHGDWRDIVIDSIMLAFWVFMLVWIHYMTVRELKSDAESEKAREDFDGSVGHLIEHIRENLHERISYRKKFTDIFKEVTGEDFFESKTVSDGHKAQIEERFNEETGKYVDITRGDNGYIYVNVLHEKPLTKKEK